MQVLDGQRLYSATDLVGFAACEHRTQLELAAARGEIVRPQRHDPFLEILVRRGAEHEAAVLAGYPSKPTAAPKVTSRRTLADIEAAAADTIEKMRSGEPAIYQATFLHDGWLGFADFVERVNAPSALGTWSYEVVDAKLSRTVKAAAVVQLCDYSEHVTRIQSATPQGMHVVTGDRRRHSYRLADFSAYHRSLKQRFMRTAVGDQVETYPEPVTHCAVCRWWADCRDRRRDDDHLSLVAGIRRNQTRDLVDAGIATRGALATAKPEDRPTGITVAAYERLRLQAALQVRGDGCVPPLYEQVEQKIDDAEDGPRGFAALPAPSPGDLFLDLEGDPYAMDGGLWYLFGIGDMIDGSPSHRAFWAHTRTQERTAFAATVDLIVQRRKQHPDMHVYHYAPAEPSAFRNLMGLHGECEDDVDALLRGGVFVDLFRIVRQSIRVSTESYSLKEVEKLYFMRPEGAVMTAGSSIVTYEQYLVDQAPLLDEIEVYNRDDCESLIGLRAWLEDRRRDAEAVLGPIPRPEAPEPGQEEIEPDDNGLLAAELLNATPDEPVERSPSDEAQYVLAHVLEWHRREAKPEWWRYFDRLAYEPEEFIDDRETIGGLRVEGEIARTKHAVTYRLQFEPQDHKFSPGATPVDPATEQIAGTIVAIDDAGTMDLSRGKGRDDPLPRALIPRGPLPTQQQRAAIAEIARWVAVHGIDSAGPYRAARDLLLRRPPRLRGTSGSGSLRRDDESLLDAARRLAVSLDNGYLAVQGPPGAGKTYTGARMIVALLAMGCRVGITATTHSAITNLISEVVEAARVDGFSLRAMQKASDDAGCQDDAVDVNDDVAVVQGAILDGKVDLAAGTAWFWSRANLRASVDVLFIDEAGQMSLADGVAVSTAARNLVLLGDPQQLAQVSKGAHPDGADASVLAHVLGERATIADDLGLFLDKTWRMHPAVCSFVSEAVYDSRLEAVPECANQSVDDSSGLWFVSVQHDRDETRSLDEAHAVAALFEELVGRPWTNSNGDTRPLVIEDLIVIAPYNAHVAALQAALPAGARVGTVDKFQGREGAVAVYSMASSSVDDAPRGMSFLYDLHRLNVAVSRARARGYIVASPELLKASCRTPEQLRLANALCRFAEIAG